METSDRVVEIKTEYRKSKWIYHPRIGVAFCAVGLFSALAAANVLAIIGWTAALASALRYAVRDS